MLRKAFSPSVWQSSACRWALRSGAARVLLRIVEKMASQGVELQLEVLECH